MKKIAATLIACCALLQVRAADPEWLTDVPKAVAQAKAENKTVLLDFTGSDWCGWCIKFKNEAIEVPEFKDYAAKNLVLVELDFPVKKPQADDLKKANQALAAQYKIVGYPTFIVLNGNGKEIGRQVGYQPGGAKAFIAELDGFKNKND